MVHLGSKQEPVEAKSLSSITTLASNPPKYPRNPTQQPLDSLVLYIVRVPGSRDVFLTPLKPATKTSISAEAINTSLYYLHVSTDDDEAIRQTIEEEQLAKRQYEEENPSSQAGDLARLNNVRRKPVGGAAAEDAPPPPPPHRSSHQLKPLDVNPERLYGQKASQSPSPSRPKSTSNLTPTGTSGEFTEPRKPLLPHRPLPQLPTDNGSGLSPVSQVNRDPSPRRWSAQPGSLAVPSLGGLREDQLDTSGGRFSLDSRRPAILPGDNSPREDNRTPNSFLQRPSRPETSRRSFDGPRNNGIPRFHVTLIRRDPSYGSQWNVGTISNHESASLGDDSTIDLEITTPAYKKLAREDEAPLSLAELGINLPSAMRDRSNSALPIPQIPSEQSSRKSSAAPVPLSFTRKVSLLPAYRHHHRFSSSNDSNDPTPRGQSPIKSPTAKTTGVYTFTSPWNGTCAFSMGVNGRSLKCKHTIAEPSSNFTTGAQSSSPTVTAAEIRFNLPAFPSSAVVNRGRHRGDKPGQFQQQQQQPQQPRPPFAQPNNNRPGSSGTESGDKRKSLSHFFNPPSQDRSHSHSPSRFRAHFHRDRPEISTLNTNIPNTHSHNNSSADPFSSPNANDESERLDLGLARERAGGGLRGKSAKLGKLIINDEGLKMLDLVVAACMGVWWQYYE